MTRRVFAVHEDGDNGDQLTFTYRLKQSILIRTECFDGENDLTKS